MCVCTYCSHSCTYTQIFGDISPGCSAVFGHDRVPAISTSFETFRSSYSVPEIAHIVTVPGVNNGSGMLLHNSTSAQAADKYFTTSYTYNVTVTAHIVTVVAPPLDTPGKAPIYLTCRPTDEIQAHVTYQRAPQITSLTMETDGPTGSGNCVALSQCTFLVTIVGPPDTVQDSADFNVSISESVDDRRAVSESESRNDQEVFISDFRHAGTMSESSAPSAVAVSESDDEDVSISESNFRRAGAISIRARTEVVLVTDEMMIVRVYMPPMTGAKMLKGKLFGVCMCVCAGMHVHMSMYAGCRACICLPPMTGAKMLKGKLFGV
jgi:hypothetical protein